MNVFRCTVIIVAILFCSTVLAAEKPLKSKTSAIQQGGLVPQPVPVQKTPLTAQQTPTKLPPKIVLDDVSVPYLGLIRLKAILYGPDGKPIVGQYVTFTINPDQNRPPSCAKTDSAGVAQWENRLPYLNPPYVLEPGVYVTEARFNGTPTIPPAARRSKLTVEKAATTFKSLMFTKLAGNPSVDIAPVELGTTYLVMGTLYANQYAVYEKNLPVAISINGVFWKNCDVNDREMAGKFACVWTPMVMPPTGGYTFTYSFAGSERYLATTATKDVKVVPAH